MPFGATPSRWCVCHFTTSALENCFLVRTACEEELRPHRILHRLSPPPIPQRAASGRSRSSSRTALARGWTQHGVILMLSRPATYCNVKGPVRRPPQRERGVSMEFWVRAQSPRDSSGFPGERRIWALPGAQDRPAAAIGTQILGVDGSSRLFRAAPAGATSVSTRPPCWARAAAYP